jgi:hypothetical protein
MFAGDYPHGDVADMGAGHIELPAAEMGNLEDLCKVEWGAGAVDSRLSAAACARQQQNGRVAGLMEVMILARASHTVVTSLRGVLRF